jgi:hypothetical protein
VDPVIGAIRSIHVTGDNRSASVAFVSKPVVEVPAVKFGKTSAASQIASLK